MALHVFPSLTVTGNTLSLSIYMLETMYINTAGLYILPRTETVQEEFKIRLRNRNDPRGWSQHKINNHLLLQKIRTTAIRSVYLSFFS